MSGEKGRVPRRKFLGYAIACIVSAVVAGVGVWATTPKPEVPPPITITKTITKTVRPEKFKVAIMVIPPKEDFGWAASFYRGAKLIEETYGDLVKVYFSDNVPYAEAEKIMRDYCEMGCNLIISAPEFEDALVKLSKEYPDICFMGLWCSSKGPNLASWRIKHSEEGGFLCGIVQGMMTKTNKCAFLGGEPYPPTCAAGNAAEIGALIVNPKVKYYEMYVGSWADPAAAKECATTLIGEGVDIIFHTCDLGVHGLIEAVKEAWEKGLEVYWIGEGEDQNWLDPEHNLCSHIWPNDKLCLEAVKKMLCYGEKLGDEIVDFGLDKYDQISDLHNCPPEVGREVEFWKQKIILGEYVVPVITEPKTIELPLPPEWTLPGYKPPRG